MLLQEEKRRLFGSVVVPFAFVAAIWTIKVCEMLFGVDLARFGIEPLAFRGLRGILFSPLLHGNLSHLLANTLPLLVLGSSLFYFYKQIALKISVILMLSTGLLTWCIARDGVHIGASSVIYGLAFFLIISGFIRKDIKLMAISFLVIFLYGGLVWGLYPKYAVDHNISWEGHLSGFVMGITLAVYYRKEGPQKEIHQWDDDEEQTDYQDENGEKPYWDIPEPDKDDLTEVWHGHSGRNRFFKKKLEDRS